MSDNICLSLPRPLTSVTCSAYFAADRGVLSTISKSFTSAITIINPPTSGSKHQYSRCIPMYSLASLYSQHPRVRYAACNAIGQMCTDFANTMQKQFHTKIVPALCGVLDDQGNPRVQVRLGLLICKLRTSWAAFHFARFAACSVVLV